VDSKQTGYVISGRHKSPAYVAADGDSLSTNAVMILQVASRSAVVLKPAPGTQTYIQFASGFTDGGIRWLPAGDTGFTFAPCPADAPGPGRTVATFYLAFSIQVDRTVPVEVLTSPSARPVWLTFMAPAGSG
jgi:hypothetical protein